jgi:hypothetical protein
MIKEKPPTSRRSRIAISALVVLIVGVLQVPVAGGASEAAVTLTLSPTAAETPLGREHTITATVTDTDGLVPKREYVIRMSVSGANTLPFEIGCRTYIPTGQCNTSYGGFLSGTKPGLDTINAYIDVDEDGSHDTDEPTAQATNTWTVPTLAVTPATAETPLGREHTITATVTDTDGLVPKREYVIRMSVSGANTLPFEIGCRTYIPTGQCTTSYSGANPGLDTLDAYIDVDEDGSRDADEPTAQATNTWFEPIPPSTPGCAGGIGTLQTNPNAGFAFGVRYRAGASAPEGALGFTDRAAGKSLVSRRITSLIIVGTHATIRGEGRTNTGQTVTFKAEVDDLSANGRLDRFAIEWPGYSASGALRTGNVAFVCPVQ